MNALTHMPENMEWSYSSIAGTLIGYALHLVLSWGEWRKLSKNANLSFWAFIKADPPGQIAGLLLVVLVYCSLTALANWQGVQAIFGFIPGVNFFSGAVTAFTSQGIGVKLMNIAKRIGDS